LYLCFTVAIDDQEGGGGVFCVKRKIMATERKRRKALRGLRGATSGESTIEALTTALPEPPPVPTFPNQLCNPALPLSFKLYRIQSYIRAFEYNYTGRSFFKKDMRKDRGMNHLTNMAKEIMRQALPIQCADALFLAVHLTNSIKKDQLMRIPITFLSKGETEAHSHIVLGVRSWKRQGEERWGALGISRMQNLMYKELKHECLASLLRNYHNAYEDDGHALEYIALGLPFPTETLPDERPRWRSAKVKLGARPDWSDVEDAVQQHVNRCDTIYTYYLKHGRFPPKEEKEKK
jgi:transcriptional regulator of met regulon